MARFTVIAVGWTLLAILVWICTFSAASQIETDLAGQVSEQLSREKISWAGVVAHGQNIELTGNAPHYRARDRAVNVAANVWGVSDVINHIKLLGAEGTCQQEFDKYLNRESIQFETGSANLDSSSFTLLERLAVIARNCSAHIEIAGYTDSMGNDVKNRRLSQKRAQAVRRYILASGVDSNLVTAVGYGESRPIADNNTSEGRQMNRRIEFRVIGGST